MSGYVCIAMLEDPPYSIYLAATEEEPEDWCAGLSLPSTLLCHGAFQDPEMIANALVKNLQAAGIKATTERAFKAPPAEVIEQFMNIRDAALQQNPGITLRKIGIKDDKKEDFQSESAGLALYEQVKELEVESPKRLALLKEAALMGYEPATDAVIEAYEHCWGNEGNFEEAVEWIVNNNIPRTEGQLWELNSKSGNVTNVKILRLLSEMGSDKARLELAQAYYKGRGTEESYRESLFWAEQTAENRLNESEQYELACLYRSLAFAIDQAERFGGDLISDPKKANSLYKRSHAFYIKCAQGNSSSSAYS